VNLKSYKELKKKQQYETRLEFSTYRDSCHGCLRSKKVCLCSNISAFATNAHIHILMHPKEARKERVGTGRMCSLSLKNSEISVGENFDDHPKIQKLLADNSYYPLLLYPGENSHNIYQRPLDKSATSGKTLLIFVIDGTWSCAKKMMKSSKILHSLPRISFPPKFRSKFDIKQQPEKFCVSTIESVYYLLEGLNLWDHENLNGEHLQLTKLLSLLVKQQIDFASNPSIGGYRRNSYKDPSARTKFSTSKRNIVFEATNSQ
jgi:DTW domain-containing protein